MKPRVALVSGLALLSWTGTSSAAKAPPPKAKELSAISQYRESIPTPVGPTFPSAGPPETAPLPPPVALQVENRGGSDAPTLKRIATESSLGAPQKRLPQQPARRRVLDEKGVTGAVFEGAGELVTDGQSRHPIGLAVVMGLLAVGAAALRRARYS